MLANFAMQRAAQKARLEEKKVDAEAQSKLLQTMKGDKPTDVPKSLYAYWTGRGWAVTQKPKQKEPDKVPLYRIGEGGRPITLEVSPEEAGRYMTATDERGNFIWQQGVPKQLPGGAKAGGKTTQADVKTSIMLKALKSGTIDNLSPAELQIMGWSRDPLLTKAIQLVSGDPANWALTSDQKMKKIEEYHKALTAYSEERPEPDFRWNPKTRKLEPVK
jgi:hypothetical protein